MVQNEIDEDKLYELTTIEEDINCIPEKSLCKEFIKEKTLKIPEVKPKIEQLAKIIIKPKITSYKLISTPIGKKVVIQGQIIEKLFYVADKPEQTVHCAKFSFPICNFIKLNYPQKIKDIKINLEELLVQMNGKRKIEECLLLFICIIPKQDC